MAYLKGRIPSDKVSLFAEHLVLGGFDIRPSPAQYELLQVRILNRWLAITIDSKGVVGLPEELVGHAEDFLRGTFTPEPVGITDTERLDFMLRKSRKVVVEIEGWGSEGRHYAVYVEEGFMADKTYSAVRFTQEEDFNGVDPHGVKIKREAIDLAINETKV
ncbi:hypothetical protein HOT57_gp66 [Pseudomonas phage phCDa]|uniref:Uncharacterized protein n=1 Tax=Pseudomonas phage phCDa TaxID=2268587 RepID=A0A2Z5H8U3_9CAUD|nr:hypothetical protein HOT57_gp66 [Pseudomonas phage phCDa]AXC36510.1 hypothetical protein phCDa_66 [Pseudomonas phage phCDa]